MQQTSQVECKFFPINGTHSFVQYEARISTAQHNYLTGSADDSGKKSNKGRVLIQCLDRSGSMHGKPFEALKAGAMQMGEACIGDEPPFERFITIFFDNGRPEVKETQNKEEYLQYMRNQNTRGAEDFVKCFKWINDNVLENNNGKVEDLTIIFLTDGVDTSNSHQQIRQYFEPFKLKLAQLKSRILTLGLGAHHDAPIMNYIAQGGSDQGNFLYIDTQQ